MGKSKPLLHWQLVKSLKSQLSWQDKQRALEPYHLQQNLRIHHESSEDILCLRCVLFLRLKDRSLASLKLSRGVIPSTYTGWVLLRILEGLENPPIRYWPHSCPTYMNRRDILVPYRRTGVEKPAYRYIKITTRISMFVSLIQLFQSHSGVLAELPHS